MRKNFSDCRTKNIPPFQSAIHYGKISARYKEFLFQSRKVRRADWKFFRRKFYSSIQGGALFPIPSTRSGGVANSALNPSCPILFADCAQSKCPPSDLKFPATSKAARLPTLARGRFYKGNDRATAFSREMTSSKNFSCRAENLRPK